ILTDPSMITVLPNTFFFVVVLSVAGTVAALLLALLLNQALRGINIFRTIIFILRWSRWSPGHWCGASSSSPKASSTLSWAAWGSTDPMAARRLADAGRVRCHPVDQEHRHQHHDPARRAAGRPPGAHRSRPDRRCGLAPHPAKCGHPANLTRHPHGLHAVDRRILQGLRGRLTPHRGRARGAELRAVVRGLQAGIPPE